MIIKICLFTKLETSPLLAKFACFNLKEKIYVVNLLNSGVIAYLSWLESAIFFSVLLVFVFWSVFLTKLLSLGILFSTAVRTVVVAKLVILGISNLASFV